jgi:predicted metal-binding membrane protein
MSNVPWFGPGVLLSIVAALVMAKPISGVLGASRLVAAMVVLSLGTVASATLTPIAAVDREPSTSRPCDMSHMSVLPLSELPTLDDRSLNVLLFVPIGLAIALVPVTNRRWTGLIIAASLPFAIEATQLAVPVLNRGCESGDVIDNLTGLLAGYLAVAAIRTLLRFATPSRDVG